MRATQVWLSGLVGTVALCLSLAASAQGGPTLKVGVIGPFTGPSSDFGVPMLQGIQLAAEEINAVGGYMGRHLELVIKDDQGNPDIGLKGAKELVAAGVAATIGFCNTGVAQKSLEVFQNAKLPLIIPCATGTPLTTQYPAPESYIFRTSARDAIQAPYVVEDIVRRGWTHVAIFADTTGYGEAGLKDVVAALAAKNLKAVHIARFPLGVKDLRTELTAAREAGADVVFSYTVGVENAVIAVGRKELKWKVPQVGAWPLSFPFFINGAKDAAEGAMMAQTFIAEPSNERRAAFLSAYRHKFQQPMAVPMAAAQGYDSTYLLAFSLFGVRDGNPTGPVLKAALENISRVYYGVVATYEHPFSRDDKDAISPNMLVMGKVSNGAVTFARPEDAKRNLLVKRKH
ncbi:ABC transporter substrate-binding protein [Candidatus Aalborgicola defluviihabitans]|uniref:ABC transporter substrate-binding protein n=1 Tax=Candidatus Aalborgicola defluviihabitans TaxID=3386187 RepID=UPI001DC753E1|nr:ABC transporter substrate-binding protein [Burkholderiales bacterium]MBK6570274.1 ABC transporter substrate-binding protein [Burkholderiales bacterium]MBK7279278.1 ABC transporter substrate-binding protein [Burkholderiales bacterium]MBK7313027.1 ABC transporter substrate-binding protein [Burkholderiales bacterium]MBL0243837.1 ABC transporter substrate-binding protein [Rhodoferax sp.]